MSWWSDGEPFDEFDYPFCRYCDGGDSKEECDRCCERHIKEADDYERAIEQTEHDMLYEPTYNPEDGSM